jgi:hypothetical protein
MLILNSQPKINADVYLRKAAPLILIAVPNLGFKSLLMRIFSRINYFCRLSDTGNVLKKAIKRRPGKSK